jgi:hypothetical protein
MYKDEEILFVIKQLLQGKGDEEQVAYWFENELASLMPGISDLIFYSEGEITAEEILRIAREKNKPIIL